MLSKVSNQASLGFNLKINRVQYFHTVSLLLTISIMNL